jgi:hypothetical protein
MVFTLELLNESEISALKDAALMLYSLGLQDSVLANYYALLLNGMKVEPWDEKPHIDFLVNVKSIPWSFMDEPVRELVPPPETEYYHIWWKYIQKHQADLGLHLIPQKQAILAAIQFNSCTFPEFPSINILTPGSVVSGFSMSIDRYISLSKSLNQKQFDISEIERWKRKIDNITEAALSGKDKELLSLCHLCLEKLRVLSNAVNKVG